MMVNSNQTIRRTNPKQKTCNRNPCVNNKKGCCGYYHPRKELIYCKSGRDCPHINSKNKYGNYCLYNHSQCNPYYKQSLKKLYRTKQTQQNGNKSSNNLMKNNNNGPNTPNNGIKNHKQLVFSNFNHNNMYQVSSKHGTPHSHSNGSPTHNWYNNNNNNNNGGNDNNPGNLVAYSPIILRNNTSRDSNSNSFAFMMANKENTRPDQNNYNTPYLYNNGSNNTNNNSQNPFYTPDMDNDTGNGSAFGQIHDVLYDEILYNMNGTQNNGLTPNNSNGNASSPKYYFSNNAQSNYFIDDSGNNFDQANNSYLLDSLPDNFNGLSIENNDDSIMFGLNNNNNNNNNKEKDHMFSTNYINNPLDYLSDDNNEAKYNINDIGNPIYNNKEGDNDKNDVKLDASSNIFELNDIDIDNILNSINKNDILGNKSSPNLHPFIVNDDTPKTKEDKKLDLSGKHVYHTDITNWKNNEN